MAVPKWKNQTNQQVRCEQKGKSVFHQKLTFAKENGLCFNCLKPGKHSARDCKLNQRCGIEGCLKKHARLLHNSFRNRNQEYPNGTNKHASPGEATTTESFFCSTQADIYEGLKVALPAVPVYVQVNENSAPFKTYALLDSGRN